MRAILDAVFHNDGDFYFKDGEKLIDPKSPLYENCDVRYIYEAGCESDAFHLVAVGSDNCILALRDLLQNMITNLRVAPTHYYLTGEIYNKLESVLNACIYNRDSSEKVLSSHEFMSGNYDGTSITATVVKDGELAGRTRAEIEYEYKQVIKDTKLIKTGPNSKGYANQERRNELLAEYRSTLSDEEQLAIFLHQHLCTSNHIDGCSWHYEIHGVIDDWNGHAHKKYLNMAKEMIVQCPDIDLLKRIILITKNSTYGVSK